ncbi:MAG: hypothetical protein JWQ09_5708 [Segetibacter sp.]|nr:hypothetical protein [Segetibacter sp.]
MSQTSLNHSIKIRFFLSSSSNQLPIAAALEANLEAEHFEPTLWSRDVHGPSQYNLEALIGEARSSDFAIFIFAPDDKAIIDGEEFFVVRDNVLFELGLFIGALGRERCFIVKSISQMRLPSDLHGITLLNYDPQRSDGNLTRALGPLVTKIKEHVRKTTSAEISAFTNNDLKLLKSSRDLSMPSNHAYKAFGSMPSAWDDKLCMRFVHLLEHGLITSIGSTEIETTRKGRLMLTDNRFQKL